MIWAESVVVPLNRLHDPVPDFVSTITEAANPRHQELEVALAVLIWFSAEVRASRALKYL